jgi:hypothetical protein
MKAIKKYNAKEFLPPKESPDHYGSITVMTKYGLCYYDYDESAWYRNDYETVETNITEWWYLEPIKIETT